MSSGSKTVGNQDVRRCLVLVRYRKLTDAPWRRVGRRPEIETYLDDVSERHRQPQIEYVTPLRVVIRVFDEQAVDLTKLVDRLGDYSRAVAKCDERLRDEVHRDEVDFNTCLEPWY